ncbi:MAG: diguanylate cyclase [Sulfurovum sp.]|nr:diguanylate cyclase [Sulfurovum sp.]
MMSSKINNLLFIVFYSLLSTLTFADNTVMLENNQARYANFTLSYFEDTSTNPLTFNEVPSQTFKEINNAFAFGYNKNNFWFHIEVLNDSQQPKKMFLELTEIIHKNVDLYIVSDYDDDLIEKNGLSVLIKERSVKVSNPSFALEFAGNEKKDIYIKLSSLYGVFGSFVLKTPEAFHADNRFNNQLYMFYFGAILMIGLYNLFIFLYLREKVYLYYVSYVFIFALWIANYKGVLLPYTSMAIYDLFQIAIPMFFTMLALFSQTVLETKKYFPSFHKILNLFIGILIISVVWMLVDMHTGFYGMNIVVAPFLPFLLFVAAWALYKKHKIARIYLLALTVYLFSMILLSQLYLGLVSYSIFTSTAPIIGSFFEIVLLSLLLAYRISKLRKEKERSQEKLLAQKASESIRLTQMVEDKTIELLKLNDTLSIELEEKERLQQTLMTEARTDDLTGALNRRAFFEMSMKELETSKRYKHPLTFLIIDIDFFKAINDTHGHLNGDIVLIDMVNVIKGTIRNTDVFGRIGGEEFAVLMPETNLDDAAHLAERIRSNVFENISLLDEEQVSITVSIGLSLLREEDNMIQTLLRRADLALFKAKENGRNQVCIEEDVAA